MIKFQQLQQQIWHQPILAKCYISIVCSQCTLSLPLKTSENQKKNPEHITLHIDINDTTKNIPNGVLDKTLALKTFIMNINKNCKVIASPLTMRCGNTKSGFFFDKVKNMIKELYIPLVTLLITTTLWKYIEVAFISGRTMNYIAAIKKLWQDKGIWQDKGYLKLYTDRCNKNIMTK